MVTATCHNVFFSFSFDFGSMMDRLVKRCQSGDLSAFTELYRAHAARTHRVCASLLVGAGEDVEDAVQQVFVQAFKLLDRFDHSSRFSTWLHGIAVGVTANMRRSQRRRGRLATTFKERRETGGWMKSPDDHIEQRQMLERVGGVLHEISEKNRVPFLLYYGSGMKLVEIAAVTDAPVQTVSARIKAAKRDILAKMPADIIAEGSA